MEMCAAVSSGLGGEEQAGESPAAAVSVHKGQWVLGVVLNHGGHGGEKLQEEAGRLWVSRALFCWPLSKATVGPSRGAGRQFFSRYFLPGVP